MEKKIRISLVGATGRLGSNIVEKIHQDEKCTLAHAVVRAQSPYVGKPLSALFSFLPDHVFFHSNYEKMMRDTDVILDVSYPDVIARYIPHALQAEMPIVIGVTGHHQTTLNLIHELSSHLPILYAPNFALGIPFLNQFVKICDTTFPQKAKVTIREWHHEGKKDAPSGTALAIAKHLKRTPEIESFREGNTVGTHSIIFESEGEVIELTHRALSTELFARGAIKACEFIQGKENGLYEMNDLLSENIS